MKLARVKFRQFWLAALSGILLLGGVGIAWVVYDLPALDRLSLGLQTPSVRFLDRYGRLLYEALDDRGGRHAVLTQAQIPDVLRQATVAVEDRRFYTHPGVDGRGVLRALWINLRGGETLAGGSTITQQVARNLLLSAEERGTRSLRRKLRESLLAVQLTRRYSKDEILALYLNQTYYGGMAYGVEAAAQTFFGKPAVELDLAESALLAGLPQSPARYNPFTDLEAAKARQEVVLGLMESNGLISAAQHAAATRQPLRLASTPYPILAPHFVLMARNWIDARFTPEEIQAHGGLIVRTSLDLDQQQQAEAAILRQLRALQDSPDDLGHQVSSAALVALDPRTGDVRALVGSPDYFGVVSEGAINMALAPRQPGSALKPLVYATALDPTRAAPWTAATRFWDVRTTFITSGGDAYVPSNYDHLEHGPVLLRTALASSLNIPAVAALDHVGMQTLTNFAARLGLTTLHDPDHYDLSLALGGGEVRLLELTAAYGAFANRGLLVTPRLILEVSDPSGAILYLAPPVAQRRVIDARVAWLISDILSDDQARLIGFGAHSILNLDRPAAVKTGTTSNFHDNWTVGYTPDLVAGVWAGNTDYRSMREVTGLTGAAPIWHDFMRAVLAGQPETPFVRPADMQQVEICALSGLLPTDACRQRRREWFIPGTAPTRPDDLYRRVILDPQTGAWLPDAPPGSGPAVVVLDLPPQAQAWGRAHDLRLLADLHSLTDAPGTGSPAAVALTSPAAGAIFRLATEFAANAQRIPFEASVAGEVRRVSFWLDDQPLGDVSTPPFRLLWTLAPGAHRVWAVAHLADGTTAQSAVIDFEVR